MRDSGFFDYIQIGEVVDNLDPRKLGRVKIYIDGISDPTLRSNTVGLPWAWQAAPIQHGGGYQKGSFSVPNKGDIVFLFFLYGDIDYPYYFASFPCIQSDPLNENKRLHKSNPPDWHSLAREMPHMLEKNRIGTEDLIEYETKYPNNTVVSFGTKGDLGINCTVEHDETPGKERIQITHLKGSYLKFGKRGDVSIKSTENQYNTTEKNKFDYVEGNKENRVRGTELSVIDGDKTEFLQSNENKTVVSNKTESVGGNSENNVVGIRKEITNAAKQSDVGAVDEETVGQTKIINAPVIILNCQSLIVHGTIAAKGLISSLDDVVAVNVSLKSHNHPDTGGPVPSASALPAGNYVAVPPQIAEITPYQHPSYPLPAVVEEKNGPETIDDPEY